MRANQRKKVKQKHARNRSSYHRQPKEIFLPQDPRSSFISEK